MSDDPDNPFREAEQVKPKAASSRPSPGVLVLAAAMVGIAWQTFYEAFPDYAPLVHTGSLFALIILMRWGRSG